MAHMTILELSPDDARKSLLQNDSYVNFDLPNYFDFTDLLTQVSAKLDVSNWIEYTDFVKDDGGEIRRNDNGEPIRRWPGYENGVNHKIIVNKNSNLSWRPLELTNPVLYVALVHLLTEPDNWRVLTSRFKELSCETIEVASIPSGRSLNRKTNKAEQITKWWEKSEQRSVELGLIYSYISETDIADCYSSIYTHSIAWAVHGRELAFKRQRDDRLLGNQIDNMIMNMRHRQTNGIPQGSALYDFIAELVLAYGDTLICAAIKDAQIENYKIIRYRDDYKIFTVNATEGYKILRIISDQLIELGLRPNTDKTVTGKSLIDASFKADKLHGLFIPKIENNFAKRLMQIHQTSERFPNSGQVSRMLNALHDDMYSKLIVTHGALELYEKPKVMISILVDMCAKNPRFYNIISAIISLLLGQLEDKIELSNIVHERLRHLPNSSLLDIWLQRAVYKYNQEAAYEEALTKIPTLQKGRPIGIWNIEWLNEQMRTMIGDTSIINMRLFEYNSDVTTRDEVDEFKDIPS
jgi:RNA-directed DNA polymerase